MGLHKDHLQIAMTKAQKRMKMTVIQHHFSKLTGCQRGFNAILQQHLYLIVYLLLQREQKGSVQGLSELRLPN